MVERVGLRGREQPSGSKGGVYVSGVIYPSHHKLISPQQFC